VEQGRGEGFGRRERVTGRARMEGGGGGRNRRALRAGEAGGGARPGRHLGPKRGGSWAAARPAHGGEGGLRAWLGRAIWAAQAV
jgi:hypothetical protein